MPNMSFSHTVEQMRSQTKSVTRRNPNTWQDLAAGDVVMACVKTQGLKKGQRIQRIGEIEIISNRVERLSDIFTQGLAYGRREAIREGYPGMTGRWFADMFVAKFGGDLDQLIRRIQFRFVTPLITF